MTLTKNNNQKMRNNIQGGETISLFHHQRQIAADSSLKDYCIVFSIISTKLIFLSQPVPMKLNPCLPLY